MANAEEEDHLFRDNTGADISVNNHYYAALLHWHLGHLDRSKWHSDEVIRITSEAGHPYSRLIGLVFGVLEVGHCRAEPEYVLRHAREVIELATNYKFPEFLLQARIQLCWAQIAGKFVEDSEFPSVCATLDTLLSTSRKSGLIVKSPLLFGIAAEAKMMAGARADAAELVREDEELGYRIFALEPPLAPGDSLRLDFDVAFRPSGFPNSPQHG